METTSVDRAISAQVAAESVINCNGDGMESETIRSVLRVAISNQVSPFYTDMVREILNLKGN